MPSMPDPILAETTYTTAHGRLERLRVKGGLRDMAGNPAPYFTLTADIDEWDRGKWHEAGGGAAHSLILAQFPEFADLAALHLSDIEGVPMHALANGYYWYEGGSAPFGRWWPAELEYGRPVTAGQQIDIIARHLRITPCESLDLFNRSLTRAQFADYIEGCRPRWAREAAACIAHHKLEVFRG